MKHSDSITFKVISWQDWSRKLIDNITIKLKIDNIAAEDLIFAPKLNPDDPRPFCKHFMFDDVYENSVFVRDHKTDNCYWYINGDTTHLIYHPKLV